MKKFISLVLALVMALSLTTIAWGAELEVGAGKTYTTIQDAVDAANPGDTIKVAAGTYAPFNIPKEKAGLTIEGTVEGGVLKTVVRTLYEGDDTIFANMRCGGINVDAANITLKNLAIQSEGYTNGRWYAAPIGHYYENVLDRTGFVVEGCTITNVATTKGGVAISFMVADITLKNNTITGYDNGWYSETGYNVDEITVTGNTFDITGNAINLVNSGTPAANSSITISGNTFTNGDVLIWDYANTTSKNNSAIKNVTLSGNTYGTGSDVILYDFKGGQADDVIDSDKAPVETYGTLANAVLLNPDATEVTIQYGTAREATYTEQSNGTWLDDNGTEYDAAGGSPRTVVAKVGNTTYETLAAAVTAAQDGDTIVLLANTAENVTIGKNVTINPNGKNYTGTVTAGANYDVIKTNGKYVVAPKTAAAGTTTTLKNADKYDIYEIAGTTSVKVAANADLTKKVTDKTTVTVGDKTTVTYTATTYSDDVNVYVEVDASIATYKLMQGNTIVAYMVNLADVGYVPTTTKVATAFVEAKKAADQVCGDNTVDGYVIDGKTYVAGGANWAVLNGKFVQYTETLVPTVPHDYAVGSYSVKDKTVATVKCVDCKATWNVLTAKQVAAMAPSAYTKLTTGAAEVIGLYIPVTVVSTGTTTDKVTSAETFDAGIAMYVGMSIMAAAGSAVVLKKKD